MKKLFILLTGITALCSAAIAGCGVKNSEQTFEPHAQDITVAEEENNGENDNGEKDENGEAPDEDKHCKDHCRKKMPRVILKHGHGNAVGFYGGISDGKFFFIRFGDGEGGNFEIYPEPLPTPLPDEIPAD